MLVNRIPSHSSPIDRLTFFSSGVMMATGKSVDGYEIHFAVNHLGHFLFTNLLLDLMKKAPSARIINVSSINHTRKRPYVPRKFNILSISILVPKSINWDDINFEKPFWRMAAYSHSKLANILFTQELARRLQGWYYRFVKRKID